MNGSGNPEMIKLRRQQLARIIPYGPKIRFEAKTTAQIHMPQCSEKHISIEVDCALATKSLEAKQGNIE